MLSIARSELIQIFRNRAVLITSLIMPVAASAFFVYQRDVFASLGSLGYIAAVIVFTIGAFSLYATTVTTLAARRQNLFLKRLRSTAAGDAAILTGLVLPVSVISLVQVGLILAVFAGRQRRAGQSAPPGRGDRRDVRDDARPGPGHGRRDELTRARPGDHAAPQPGDHRRGQLDRHHRHRGPHRRSSGCLPGGSATELVVNAWNGGVPLADSLLLLAPTLAWVVVAIALAVADVPLGAPPIGPRPRARIMPWSAPVSHSRQHTPTEPKAGSRKHELATDNETWSCAERRRGTRRSIAGHAGRR